MYFQTALGLRPENAEAKDSLRRIDEATAGKTRGTQP